MQKYNYPWHDINNNTFSIAQQTNLVYLSHVYTYKFLDIELYINRVINYYKFIDVTADR